MPSSLIPLPDEMTSAPASAGKGGPDPTTSAFAGGTPPVMAALAQIETGLKQLGATMPSLLPMCAQMISQLRMAVPDSMGAGAGAPPSGGPGGPAITGMGQNPTALPAPPQGM